jgi:hypothetical protein
LIPLDQQYENRQQQQQQQRSRNLRWAWTPQHLQSATF